MRPQTQNHTTPLILIVDEDARHSQMLKVKLAVAGFQVVIIARGETAVEQFSFLQPNLVILEVELPDISGYQVCEQIRKLSKTPIIFLTHHSDLPSRIKGFNMGGDDYLTKPCSLEELTARVKAVMRRFQTALVARPRQIFQRDNLVIDFDRAEVFLDGRLAELSPTEYKLLIHFAKHAGQLQSTEQLLLAVWGEQYRKDREILWVSLARLRSKVERNIKHPDHIVTLGRKGYFMPSPNGGDPKPIQPPAHETAPVQMGRFYS